MATVLEFVASLRLPAQYDAKAAGFQFDVNVSWITSPNIHYHIAVDGISLWLVVLTVEVTAYDQAWTGDGKAARAGVIAEAFMLPAGPGGWRVYREARVDDRRGHAFQSALDEAVSSLAAAIVPFNAVPVVDVRPRAEAPPCC